MKKRKLVAVLITLVLVMGMVGCGKGEEKKTTFTTSQNGVVIEMNVTSEGDNITNITQSSTLSAKGYSKEQMQKAADQAKAKYDAIEGCSYESNISDSEFSETIIMNINSDSLKKLIAANLLPITNKEAQVLSLEETRKSLTSQGWKEK